MTQSEGSRWNQVYQSEIEQFCSRVKESFNPNPDKPEPKMVLSRKFLHKIQRINWLGPDCIILHGSITLGTYTRASDIDIIVIGDQFPDPLNRPYELNRLRDGTTPIEVIGYNLSEWELMMKQLHLTVLEALHWGIPLHGKKLFQQWKTKLEEWKSMGLRREKMSWSIPQALQQRMPRGRYLQLSEAEKQLLRSRLREASAAVSKRAAHLSDDEVDQLIERARSESYEERRAG